MLMEKIKNNRFIILECILFTLLFSPAILYSKNRKGVTYTCSNDTIISKLNYCSNPAKNKFFNVEDICISTDYAILDSTTLYVNNNAIPSKILILSPTINDQDYTNAPDCRNSKYNKRLFVLLAADKDKFHVRLINEHLILNEYDEQSEPYRKITTDKNGFTLKYFIGSINKCNFNFHFVFRGNDIYLIDNEYNCYTSDLKTSKKGIRKYNIKIDKVDINKYLDIP
jgi:hypothetical protein